MKTAKIDAESSAQTTVASGSSDAPVEALAALERESIDLFVRLSDLIGVPRSVGELYGFLFVSPEPLSMDALSDRLQLSKGATSQGLRLLRNVGAVRVVYRVGDRRDHFVAETELRKLVDGFLREQVQPHVESGGQRIERMKTLLQDVPEAHNRSWYEDRLERLERWQKRAHQFLPLLTRITRI